MNPDELPSPLPDMMEIAGIPCHVHGSTALDGESIPVIRENPRWYMDGELVPVPPPRVLSEARKGGPRHLPGHRRRRNRQ